MFKKIVSFLCCAAMAASLLTVSAAPDCSGEKQAAWDYLQENSDKLTYAYYTGSVINAFSPSSGQILHLTNYVDPKKEPSLLELSEQIVALGAVQQNPEDINSVNLFHQLDERNLNNVFPDDTEALFFSIAAVYRFPENFTYEKWTKDSLLQTLLHFQNEDGGFPSELGSASDVYPTQYAMMGLSFYPDSPGVKAAMARAVDYMDASDFAPKTGNDLALLVQSLSAAGVSPEDDRFLLDGKTPLSILLTFVRDDGGFAQDPSSGDSSVNTTQEAMLALYAAEHGTNPYDLTKIAPAYQPPNDKTNVWVFFGKFLLVLGIIYLSLTLVSRYGKKKNAEEASLKAVGEVPEEPAPEDSSKEE